MSNIEQISNDFIRYQNSFLEKRLNAIISSAIWLGYDGYRRGDTSLLVEHNKGEFTIKYTYDGVDDFVEQEIKCYKEIDCFNIAFNLLKY